MRIVTRDGRNKFSFFVVFAPVMAVKDFDFK